MSFERALNNQFSRKLQDLTTLLTSLETKLDANNTKLDANNTKLDSIDIRLDNCDSSLNTIEADSGFIKSRLYDAGTNLGAGELLAVSNTILGAGIDTLNDKLDELKTELEAIKDNTA